MSSLGSVTVLLASAMVLLDPVAVLDGIGLPVLEMDGLFAMEVCRLLFLEIYALLFLETNILFVLDGLATSTW